ncbi:FAD-binding oxidoreductase [Novosphingobium sp.]|uniref:FAD-binding oxidoreductase n=1 Tax=Novosphingobium sp. TaxID=1874826 RepID=UPI001ECBF2CB|nr:FAD-binding oxidoreductase [Novosphingobium sp.]MBK9009307.1 FAD-binding oxidoreductase [Novosphingobium sp.]
MTASASAKAGDLPQQLAQVLGAGAVRSDADSLDFFAHDVFAQGARALCVVRPDSIAALQAAVRTCAAAGVAMVPRGGGASYTDGYLTNRPHVLFDLSALDFIEIDAANAMVRVGAGTTWAALKAALDPLGLRTPFWGPFSGIAASVGGSVSQNTISHGSGAHGISAQSVLGIEVVLADGTLLNTAASRATRHYGPDLTGLFTGDCGALGLKAALRSCQVKSHRTRYAPSGRI